MFLLLSSLVYASGFVKIPDENIILGIVFLIVAFIVYYIIIGYTTYIYHQTLMSIPKEHRTISPYLVWANLLPICFVNNLISGIVAISLIGSFQSYFRSIEDESQDELGNGIAVAYLVAHILSCIPYLGILFLIPLPFLWFFLIRRLKKLSAAVKASAIIAPQSP